MIQFSAVQHLLQTLLDTPFKCPSSLQSPASQPIVPNHFSNGSTAHSTKENRVLCQQADAFERSDLWRCMTMPSNCWVPTSYYALSHSLTEPQLWLLWDCLGTSVNGLETRSWQPVLSRRMISWLFFPTTLGFIRRSAGVAGCQKPAHFLNNRLPLMGGNWYNKVSHCTPNDPTEATAQPKGSSQDRLLNTVVRAAIPYLPSSPVSLLSSHCFRAKEAWKRKCLNLWGFS